MTIPEEQFEIWSNQGAVASAQATHISVRAALAADSSHLGQLNYYVFLQGSYRNATNVRADSDVDIVVRYNSAFNHNVHSLPPNQKSLFDAQHTNATYRWPHFRAEVFGALRAYYGTANVEESERCLKVAAASGRVAGDVVPALPFRNYNYFFGLGSQSYVEGIRFEDRNGTQIVNYPDQHYENGLAKNSIERTGGRFKRTVRMFKNARTRAVDSGLLSADAASSYFLDCLLWNVPDNLFSPSRQETFCGILNHLNRAVLTGYFCRNGIVPLFGTSPGNWTESNARQMIAALIRLWNDW
jgi:hypothetical protein